jgi:two-component system, OmpR family, response regulator
VPDRQATHSSAVPTPAAHRLLVIEDDAGVAGGIVRGLRAAGFDVELSTNGIDGAKKALEGAYAAIVLDLMLPEQTGFAILEQLQGRTAAPILVLTAKNDLADRLRCFGLGAADFITKPFWMEELVARLRTRLRINSEAPKRVIRWANVALDLDSRLVTVGDDDAGLTRNEFDLLAHLVERQGRAISRVQLAEHALTPFEQRDARTVDSHIARIRRKLGAEGGGRVVTVWGIGYRFEPDKDDPGRARPEDDK